MDKRDGLDKKVQDGRLRLVASDGIGRAAVTDAAPEDAIIAAIEGGVCSGGRT